MVVIHLIRQIKELKLVYITLEFHDTLILIFPTSKSEGVTYVQNAVYYKVNITFLYFAWQ